MNVQPMLKFMQERHNIYLRRFQRGEPAPWTKDKILHQYKFTNVYRELDRVTIWVREHIREPYAQHPHLWFMLCIARQLNWPGTLQEMMDEEVWPDKEWNWKAAVKVLDARAKRGDKVFTGAYIVTNGGIPQPKTRVVLERYLQPLWKNREDIGLEFKHSGTMENVHARLMQYMGWGGFMAYEVVCDMRYTRYLQNATDINTWAHAGPGALRGLMRVTGTKPSQRDALPLMRQLHKELNAQWPYTPALEMREVEHSLCEFDKYERTRKGEGRPRSKFVPWGELE